MATLFRAIVMLIVLVGLPAAWVFYDPLPPSAMGVIRRTIDQARYGLGWQRQSEGDFWRDEAALTAPRFDRALAKSAPVLRQPPSAQPTTDALQAITRDSQFALASAAISASMASVSPAVATAEAALAPTGQAATPSEVSTELARQLEPHLSLLRKLNAAEYTLENWGRGGRLYRFRCAIALAEGQDHTRQFEAVDAEPLRAVRQVVGEVTSWQNARHTGGATRWR